MTEWDEWNAFAVLQCTIGLRVGVIADELYSTCPLAVITLHRLCNPTVVMNECDVRPTVPSLPMTLISAVKAYIQLPSSPSSAYRGKPKRYFTNVKPSFTLIDI